MDIVEKEYHEMASAYNIYYKSTIDTINQKMKLEYVDPTKIRQLIAEYNPFDDTRGQEMPLIMTDVLPPQLLSQVLKMALKNGYFNLTLHLFAKHLSKIPEDSPLIYCILKIRSCGPIHNSLEDVAEAWIYLASKEVLGPQITRTIINMAQSAETPQKYLDICKREIQRFLNNKYNL